jgi:hypothetical protein
MMEDNRTTGCKQSCDALVAGMKPANAKSRPLAVGFIALRIFLQVLVGSAGFEPATYRV